MDELVEEATSDLRDRIRRSVEEFLSEAPEETGDGVKPDQLQKIVDSRDHLDPGLKAASIATRAGAISEDADCVQQLLNCRSAVDSAESALDAWKSAVQASEDAFDTLSESTVPESDVDDTELGSGNHNRNVGCGESGDDSDDVTDIESESGDKRDNGVSENRSKTVVTPNDVRVEAPRSSADKAGVSPDEDDSDTSGGQPDGDGDERESVVEESEVIEDGSDNPDNDTGDAVPEDGGVDDSNDTGSDDGESDDSGSSIQIGADVGDASELSHSPRKERGSTTNSSQDRGGDGDDVVSSVGERYAQEEEYDVETERS